MVFFRTFGVLARLEIPGLRAVCAKFPLIIFSQVDFLLQLRVGITTYP
jgi:hypothetical protein